MKTIFANLFIISSKFSIFVIKNKADLKKGLLTTYFKLLHTHITSKTWNLHLQLYFNLKFKITKLSKHLVNCPIKEWGDEKA